MFALFLSPLLPESFMSIVFSNEIVFSQLNLFGYNLVLSLGVGLSIKKTPQFYSAPTFGKAIDFGCSFNFKTVRGHRSNPLRKPTGTKV